MLKSNYKVRNEKVVEVNLLKTVERLQLHFWHIFVCPVQQKNKHNQYWGGPDY